MKRPGLLSLNILVNIENIGIDSTFDVYELISSFKREELVEFALELIYNKSLSNGWINFCKRFFPERYSNEIICFINNCLRPTTNEPELDYHIVCMQTGLELLKFIFSSTIPQTPVKYDKIKDGDIIRGIRLLTIVLFLNKGIAEIDNPIDENIDGKDVLANMIAASLVGSNDYSNFDPTTTPFILLYKATLLLEFCKNSSVLKVPLEKTLTHYGCSDIKTYLSYILRMFTINSEFNKSCCHILFSEGEQVPDIFESLSISLDENISTDKNIDYTAFRARPIIKFSKHDYVITCLPFLLDKFYNSIIFDLSHHLNDGNKVREIISKQFTEKQLLFPLLKKIIFPKSRYNLSGDECNVIQEKLAPDFYARNWDNIYLIELKDYSFRASEKVSASYNTINNYLYNQFVKKPNGRNGAIRQLVNNIKAILNQDFVWDQDIKTTKHIYPVLVLGNSNYLNYGITYILNRFFREELVKESISSSIVQDLLIIDIDTLILYEKIWSKTNTSFHSIVKLYFKTIKSNSNKLLHGRGGIFEYMQPFPQFLRRTYKIDSTHLSEKLYKLETWTN